MLQNVAKVATHARLTVFVVYKCEMCRNVNFTEKCHLGRVQNVAKCSKSYNSCETHVNCIEM
jgi:hypothetical protein